jgi:hypothetical protein
VGWAGGVGRTFTGGFAPTPQIFQTHLYFLMPFPLFLTAVLVTIFWTLFPLPGLHLQTVPDDSENLLGTPFNFVPCFVGL